MQLSRRHGKESALRIVSGMAGAERPGSHRRGVYDAGVATFFVRVGDHEGARRAAQAGAANEHPEVRQVAERLLILTRLG